MIIEKIKNNICNFDKGKGMFLKKLVNSEPTILDPSMSANEILNYMSINDISNGLINNNYDAYQNIVLGLNKISNIDINSLTDASFQEKITYQNQLVYDFSIQTIYDEKYNYELLSNDLSSIGISNEYLLNENNFLIVEV